MATSKSISNRLCSPASKDAVLNFLWIENTTDNSIVINKIIERNLCTQDEAALYLREYHKFIYLLGAEFRCNELLQHQMILFPSAIVNRVWRLHQLFTTEYPSLCRDVGFSFLNFNPDSMSFWDKSANAINANKRAYEKTLTLLQKEFKEPLDNRVWPATFDEMVKQHLLSFHVNMTTFKSIATTIDYMNSALDFPTMSIQQIQEEVLPALRSNLTSFKPTKFELKEGQSAKRVALYETMKSYQFPKELLSYLKNEYLLNEESVGSVVEEYKKFLMMGMMEKSFSQVPSAFVDEVWHTHINFAKCYMQTCLSLAGFVLTHAPATAIEENEQEIMSKEFEQTIQMQCELFGEVNEQYWQIGGHIADDAQNFFWIDLYQGNIAHKANLHVKEQAVEEMSSISTDADEVLSDGSAHDALSQKFCNDCTGCSLLEQNTIIDTLPEEKNGCNGCNGSCNMTEQTAQKKSCNGCNGSCNMVEKGAETKKSCSGCNGSCNMLEKGEKKSCNGCNGSCNMLEKKETKKSCNGCNGSCNMLEKKEAKKSCNGCNGSCNMLEKGEKKSCNGCNGSCNMLEKKEIKKSCNGCNGSCNMLEKGEKKSCNGCNGSCNMLEKKETKKSCNGCNGSCNMLEKGEKKSCNGCNGSCNMLEKKETKKSCNGCNGSCNMLEKGEKKSCNGCNGSCNMLEKKEAKKSCNGCNGSCNMLEKGEKKSCNGCNGSCNMLEKKETKKSCNGCNGSCNMLEKGEKKSCKSCNGSCNMLEKGEKKSCNGCNGNCNMLEKGEKKSCNGCNGSCNMLEKQTSKQRSGKQTQMQIAEEKLGSLKGVFTQSGHSNFIMPFDFAKAIIQCRTAPLNQSTEFNNKVKNIAACNNNKTGQNTESNEINLADIISSGITV